MIRLDHLVIAAPSLEDGIALSREALGIDMAPGGKHPTMGTHNRLLRLGPDVYLEVIALDPAAPPQEGPRWFGLHDAARTRRLWDEGRRLGCWVANTDDLDATLVGRQALFGQAAEHRRDDLTWRFAFRDDGLPAMEGALPCLIEWPGGASPVPRMPDLGCRLRRLVIEHPAIEKVRATLAGLTLLGPVELRGGPAASLKAEIETPRGVKWL